jgi:hypothetical protein
MEKKGGGHRRDVPFPSDRTNQGGGSEELQPVRGGGQNGRRNGNQRVRGSRNRLHTNTRKKLVLYRQLVELVRGREGENEGMNPANFWSVVCWDGFPDGGSGGEQERERSSLTSSGQTGWG